MRNVIAIAAAMFIIFAQAPAISQHTQPYLQSYFRKGKGMGVVASDSLFSLNYQFRMQNRATYTSKSNSLEPNSFEFRVRRLRMKFEGFVYDPRLTYYIQLSFSRGDMDWNGTDNSNVNHSPNVVRDAVIYYSPTKRLRFGLGQTKLPGNRQRVVSSGDQQFADRSIVNATFNIDRDFGFFAQYTGNFFNLRGALTSGEGRNAVVSNSGLAYTGRIELLPLGKFTGNNDYQEGDLERESSPKISIAGTYSFNDRAVRERGQVGNDLYHDRGIRNYEADILFKYNGWAWYNEYMKRNASNPITVNSDRTDIRMVYVGEGYLSQLSYLFKNNFEFAARYSLVKPFPELSENPFIEEPRIQQVEFGVTKYLVGHRVKIQGNVIHNDETNMVSDRSVSSFWSAVFQVEIGI